MPAQRSLFLPGWGAPPGLYRRGLPEQWESLEPPCFKAGGGELQRYVDWLIGIVDGAGAPVVLAGHSMGGALAVLAAAMRPDRVSRLVLFGPAGLPLQKPIRSSLAAFGRQAARDLYSPRVVCDTLLDVARAPRAALRLAEAVRGLDLTREMEAVCVAAIPTTVIACTGDTLVTPDHCRRSAALLGGTYRVVALPDGHMWMPRGWRRMRSELLAATI